MATFSVAITKTGWSVKDMETGKILRGVAQDMPTELFIRLERAVGKPSYLRCACVSSTVTLPWEDPLTRWFKSMHQSALTGNS